MNNTDTMSKSELIEQLRLLNSEDSNIVTGYCNGLKPFKEAIKKHVNEGFVDKPLSEQYYSLMLGLEAPSVCLMCGSSVRYVGKGRYKKYCSNRCQFKYMSLLKSEMDDYDFLMGYYYREHKGFTRAKDIIYEEFGVKVNKKEVFDVIERGYITHRTHNFNCLFCGKKDLYDTCDCLVKKSRKQKEKEERIRLQQEKKLEKIRIKEEIKNREIENREKLKQEKLDQLTQKRLINEQKQKRRLMTKLLFLLKVDSMSLKELQEVNNQRLLKNKHYTKMVLKYTDFLDNYDPSLLERVYCIKNDINDLVYCGFCGKRIPFNGRTYTKYCSKTCNNKSRLGENNPCHKQSKETKLRSIEKQSNTMKKKIQSGEYTPIATNAWANSRVKIKTNVVCGDIKCFRSTWEALFWIMNVDLEYEKIRIPYEHEQVFHNYITDFQDYENRIIYEVKPHSQLKTNAKVKSKEKAAKLWCEENGWEFVYITEDWFKANISRLDENVLERRFDYESVMKLKKSIDRFKGVKV